MRKTTTTSRAGTGADCARTPSWLAGHEAPIACAHRVRVEGGAAELGPVCPLAIGVQTSLFVRRDRPSPFDTPSAKRAAPSLDFGVPEMRCDGEIWRIAWNGKTCRLQDAKGLHDLQTLLRQPGREFHCLALMGAVVEQKDLGPTLDARARRELGDRIRDLQEELDEAQAYNDLGRAERCQAELHRLIEELKRASGLCGRDRRPGRSAERARCAVTWRIRAAIKRINKLHPALGHHLQHTIRTGTFCSYQGQVPTA